jgi:hypothetical protein
MYLMSLSENPVSRVKGAAGVALKSSVKTGFKPAVPEAGFTAGLAKQAPLPEGCDF